MPKLRTTLTFWIALLFLLLVGLQIFPLTGVFLMMVGAPIWVGFFPHLIALALVTDILIRKKFPKFLLILPLLPYAAYYIFFALDARYIKIIEQELQSQNPVEIITYTPDQHNLIVPNHYNHLIDRYKIPVIYEENINHPEKYYSYRILTGDLCVQSRGIKEHGHTTGTISWKMEKPFAYKNFTNLCKLKMPEAPQKQHLIIIKTNRNTGENKKPSPRTVTAEYDFYLGQKHLGSFITANYTAMPRFPIFVIGCALISSRAAWKCVYQLRYNKKVLNTFPKNTDLEKYNKNPVAQMLKIEKYTEDDLTNFQNDPENERLLKELIAKKPAPQPCDDPDNEWGCYFNNKKPDTSDTEK